MARICLLTGFGDGDGISPRLLVESGHQSPPGTWDAEPFQHPAEAVASLEAAGKKFLDKVGRSDPTPNVLVNFACENDKACSEVLAKTYGVCNFHDICEFSGTARKAYCTTHKRRCCVIKRHSSKRHLARPIVLPSSRSH